MVDPEVKAIGEVAKALEELSVDQVKNVLAYITSRYGSQARMVRMSAEINAEPRVETARHGSLGEFFDAANPQTEAEKVLAVAYWKQTVEGAEDFESFPVNQELKHLGQPVSNITRALDSMISQSPRFVIQIAKSGSSKQARKRYKVTREGVKRIQSMLAQANEGRGNG